ncbi:efflux transporter outer membrane subunit [Hymenobacter sp.]|uniref:efflux transporter outer membrane subunit n=1 Tax=Hymenobacter sp. TaxID=1898978 RepID=UPI00286B2485|nr:efflux transporter outer membrane subunit [Hymenobacter sp.]
MTLRPSYVFLGLLLSACATAPRYRPPAVATPAAWQHAGAADTAGSRIPTAAETRARMPPPAFGGALTQAQATAAPAVVVPDTSAAARNAAPQQLPQAPPETAWWTVFNDPVLTQLEEQALAQNFTAQAAVARVEQARARLQVANSYRSPDVTLNPAAYRTRLSGLRPVPFDVPIQPVTQTQYFVPLNVSYEVDVWGRVRRNVQAARADAEAAAADAQAVRLSLTADAATYYFDLRGLDAELAVLDSARLARVRNVQLTQARFRAGVDNEIGWRRAETELANVEASLLELGRQRAGVAAALATVVGQPASSFVLAPRPGTELPAAPAVPLALPAALLARRPDLRRAERQLAAADARTDAARLARRPSVQLTGFIGPQSAELAKLSQINNGYTYYLGGGVAIPIFNGGRLRGNEQLAQAQYRELEAQYRGAALVAFQDVETALANLRLSAAQLAAQQRALRAARLAGRLTEVRYRSGLTNYFEIVDADRQTLDAARLLAQTQADQLRYEVLLVRALGGNW